MESTKGCSNVCREGRARVWTRIKHSNALHTLSLLFRRRGQIGTWIILFMSYNIHVMTAKLQIRDTGRNFISNHFLQTIWELIIRDLGLYQCLHATTKESHSLVMKDDFSFSHGGVTCLSVHYYYTIKSY